jgi:putative FmdB family regulatory protein
LPVYDYKCTKGHLYEKTEGFDAPSRQKCMKCGSVARRQISMPAVIFKGSGFYSTDNRKGSAGTSPADSSSSEGGDSSPSSNGKSSNGASSDSGSESKAEATTAD